jgi:hypothetical protein
MADLSHLSDDELKALYNDNYKAVPKEQLAPIADQLNAEKTEKERKASEAEAARQAALPPPTAMDKASEFAYEYLAKPVGAAAEFAMEHPKEIGGAIGTAATLYKGREWINNQNLKAASDLFSNLSNNLTDVDNEIRRYSTSSRPVPQDLLDRRAQLSEQVRVAQSKIPGFNPNLKAAPMPAPVQAPVAPTAPAPMPAPMPAPVQAPAAPTMPAATNIRPGPVAPTPTPDIYGRIEPTMGPRPVMQPGAVPGVAMSAEDIAARAAIGQAARGAAGRALGAVLGGPATAAMMVMQPTELGPKVPSTGPLRGSELNPATNRPWSAQELAEYDAIYNPPQQPSPMQRQYRATQQAQINQPSGYTPSPAEARNILESNDERTIRIFGGRDKLIQIAGGR